MEKYKCEILSFEQFYKAFDIEKLPQDHYAYMEACYRWYRQGIKVGYKNKIREIKAILDLDEDNAL